MKISLNWIFDHIDGSVRDVEISPLINTFIKTTAEIEEWRKVTCDMKLFTLVHITHITDNEICAYSPEHNQTYNLPLRADIRLNYWYLIDNICGTFSWSTINSVGGTKDVLLPAIYVEESQRAGHWKQHVETQDYVLEIDNKSINHRPDLWGHRGIAREVAAILNIPLKKIDEFIVAHNSIACNVKESVCTGEFSIKINSDDVCDRFAALQVLAVENRPSDIDMVIRFARLDHKAIDYLIDCTNYVMFDLGQPMHAFDAHTLAKKNLTVRRAHTAEKLLLLDGDALQLNEHDIVIADGDKAVSLAGVMGGFDTGIGLQTRSLLLEAAHFDATTIRRTAARYKKRTEASMRFEKNIDPYQSEQALLRFLWLLKKNNHQYQVADELAVLGNTYHPVQIDIQHNDIEKALGISVSSEHITTILKKLSFDVEKHEGIYTITIPSFRATKDVAIAEDIIEEIGRYIGYDSITPVMPAIRSTATNVHKTYTTRAIKRLLSNSLLMRELYGYSFFDESFLRTLQWDPEQCVEIKNPISENYIRLVSSLQPHLLKAIGDNSVHHTQLRFYEWARVWSNKNNDIVEQKALSGVFFDRTELFDFYEGKSLLLRLFDELRLRDVEWHHNDQHPFNWLAPYQTAKIMHQGHTVGIAGMVENNIVNRLSDAPAPLFIFELDADYLLNYQHDKIRFTPLPKYPAVYRDVSVMIELSTTVDTISRTIKNLDDRIKSIVLIDFFAKDEWINQKSLTFHIEIRDEYKTLEHTHVEEVWNKISTALTALGAVIR